MIQRVLAYLEANSDADSHAVCGEFGLSRGMAERILAFLEDTGAIRLETPKSGCSGGGCSTGGCSTSGPASAINALAEAAREKKRAG